MCRKTALIMLAPEMPRHDKLRDFHLAVERELQLEAETAEFTVSMEDISEEAGRGWLEAVEGYGHIGVGEPQLVTYLGIGSPSEVPSEQLRELEDLFGRARKNDKDAVAEIEKMRAGLPAAPSNSDAQSEGQQHDAEPQPMV
jgi:hypothetical protein